MSGPDVANPGLLRPPFLYLGSIGVGLLVHSRWPARWLPAGPNVPIGIAVVLAAIGLFVSSVRALRGSDTPAPGDQSRTTLVRSGAYGLSRNPIYLAFTLAQLGIAARVNGLAVLLTLIPTTAVIALVVVPREERYLQARFQTDYERYRRAVPALALGDGRSSPTRAWAVRAPLDSPAARCSAFGGR